VLAVEQAPAKTASHLSGKTLNLRRGTPNSPESAPSVFPAQAIDANLPIAPSGLRETRSQFSGEVPMAHDMRGRNDAQ